MAYKIDCIGESLAKGVGSVMVWAPTDKLGDEDSKYDVITRSCDACSTHIAFDVVEAYLDIAKEKFGYGAEQVGTIWNIDHTHQYC